MAVLAKSKIKELLDEGEIFIDGSWKERCLRSAAYNLRVAPDFLIDPKGTRYWSGDPDGRTARQTSFYLEPGDVAFVSSVERLCMPFDLAGNIAQKFSVTRNGILVLGGLLVDPGYGRELRRDGRWWIRENGQRLHFQLANVGKEKFRVVPEETSIAAIQFLRLEGFVMVPGEFPADVSVPNSDQLLYDLFVKSDGKPLAPLAFFPRMADLRDDLDHARGQIKKQEIKLDSTKKSTDQLVVFGVFLLAITLFTVACAALIDAIAKGSTTDAADAVRHADISAALSQDSVVTGVVVAGVVIAFCLAASACAFGIFIARQKHREKKVSAGVTQER
jgi:deoxycytidine triphosphate deaminase